MTLEGASVKAVCELMPYSSGLARNIEQCLNDFNIPLRLSHTVVELHGKERLTGVTIARVDENRKPIKETFELIPCDTLLLSCGLIPENELTKGIGAELSYVTNGSVVDQNRETTISGVFSCGNVLHVHDLVDYVSEEAEIAGKGAAEYIKGINEKSVSINVTVDGKIRYTVPQVITEKKDVTVYLRVNNVYKNVRINVYDNDRLVLSKKKLKVAPAEMEAVKLSASMLENVTALKFVLEEEK
jgi:pyruvate/2-oxoglutarate dehydrogenase complex dihydrolipoamide dehydrogenase (E3) component